MNIYARSSLREICLVADKRLEVYFYTSNDEKYLHASTVFSRSGLTLKYFRSKYEPYSENYEFGKELLLTNAIEQIQNIIGKQSLFFVEDTSLRINALSTPIEDFPGLAVKEWFGGTTFEQLDAKLKKGNKDRSAAIKSDIALHIPGLHRPLFFHGKSEGHIAHSSPSFKRNYQYPWLTPATFNGWFIPVGTNKRLGEMSLEESWKHDFRTQAIESMVDRIEEYTAILNAPSHAYVRTNRGTGTHTRSLFPENRPVIIVVGKTCSGKTTFGSFTEEMGLQLIEASTVLRTLALSPKEKKLGGYELAKKLIDSKGPDIVAQQVIKLYGETISQGSVISGFRTIEELETIKAVYPNAIVVLLESSERDRFQRYLSRARAGSVSTRKEFRYVDQEQWQFGLLRIAEEFADLRINNFGTERDFKKQVQHVVRGISKKTPPGIARLIKPRYGMRENQLYRCLLALSEANGPMTCNEIQTHSRNTGKVIRFNNVNKVLKKVPELAKRYDGINTPIKYDITSAGKAYIRYMKTRYNKKAIIMKK